AQFEDDPIPHSKNSAAEAAVMRLLDALTKEEPIDVFESLVADGKAKQLRGLNAFNQWWFRSLVPLRTPGGKESFDRTGARDVAAGDRIVHADGRAQVIRANDLGGDKALLMLVVEGDECIFFWVKKQGGQWKVDVANLIDAIDRIGLPVFGEIRTGMDL